MAIRSGLAAQLGLGVESTWGTAATVNRFFEFTSEDLKLEVERLESAGLRAGNRVLRSDRFVVGTKAVSGSVSLDMTAENSGLLFKHALGKVTTTTLSGSAKQHLCEVDDPYSLGFTMEVGRPGNDGTVRAFQYTGMKVSNFTLSSSTNELLTGEFSFVGKDESTAGSLTAASYPASQELLSFVGATITVDGSAYEAKEFSVEVDNGLDAERYILGSQTINQPVAAGMMEITGSVTAEFKDLTAYNRFVNATTCALKATWEGTAITGTYKRKIEVNMPVVRWDGETPAVGGPEIVDQPLNYKALYNGTDSPISVTVVNTDSAA